MSISRCSVPNPQLPATSEKPENEVKVFCRPRPAQFGAPKNRKASPVSPQKQSSSLLDDAQLPCITRLDEQTVRFRGTVPTKASSCDRESSISDALHSQFPFSSPSSAEHLFTFSHVFSENAPQSDVYNKMGKPIVEDVLLGYNGSILVYGQTGSGKTHTVFGSPFTNSFETWRASERASREGKPMLLSIEDQQQPFFSTIPFTNEIASPIIADSFSPTDACSQCLPPLSTLIPVSTNLVQLSDLQEDFLQTPDSQRSLFSLADNSPNTSKRLVPAPKTLAPNSDFTVKPPECFVDPGLGLAARALETIFDAVRTAEAPVKYEVELSLVEIYMERVRDLLADRIPGVSGAKRETGGRPGTGDQRKVREDVLHKTFFVEKCHTPQVRSTEEALSLVMSGLKRRTTASTAMNDTSSRSHCLLSLVVRRSEGLDGEMRVGRLALVDLAGSEKVSRTHSIGMQLEEAKLINKSLSTLSMVIDALTSHSSHVPYRNSVLTMLLKDSLGGNARTSMVVCCAPEGENASETVSTLRFGALARKMVNRAQLNEVPYQRLSEDIHLSSALEEIARLRAMCATTTEKLKSLERETSPEVKDPLRDSESISQEEPVTRCRTPEGLMKSTVTGLHEDGVDSPLAPSTSLASPRNISIACEQSTSNIGHMMDVSSNLFSPVKQGSILPEDVSTTFTTQEKGAEVYVESPRKRNCSPSNRGRELTQRKETFVAVEHQEENIAITIRRRSIQRCNVLPAIFDDRVSPSRQRFKNEKTVSLSHNEVAVHPVVGDGSDGWVEGDKKFAFYGIGYAEDEEWESSSDDEIVVVRVSKTKRVRNDSASATALSNKSASHSTEALAAKEKTEMTVSALLPCDTHTEYPLLTNEENCECPTSPCAEPYEVFEMESFQQNVEDISRDTQLIDDTSEHTTTPTSATTTYGIDGLPSQLCVRGEDERPTALFRAYETGETRKVLTSNDVANAFLDHFRPSRFLLLPPTTVPLLLLPPPAGNLLADRCSELSEPLNSFWAYLRMPHLARDFYRSSLLSVSQFQMCRKLVKSDALCVDRLLLSLNGVSPIDILRNAAMMEDGQVILKKDLAEHAAQVLTIEDISNDERYDESLSYAARLLSVKDMMFDERYDESLAYAAHLLSVKDMKFDERYDESLAYAARLLSVENVSPASYAQAGQMICVNAPIPSIYFSCTFCVPQSYWVHLHLTLSTWQPTPMAFAPLITWKNDVSVVAAKETDINATFTMNLVTENACVMDDETRAEEGAAQASLYPKEQQVNPVTETHSCTEEERYQKKCGNKISRLFNARRSRKKPKQCRCCESPHHCCLLRKLTEEKWALEMELYESDMKLKVMTCLVEKLQKDFSRLSDLAESNPEDLLG